MGNPLEVVVHPVRMRILMSLAGRELSALQIAEMLGDVPQATLYRHLRRLLRAGVLTVAAERQVRGTVEKIYAVNEKYEEMRPDRLAEISVDDHQRYFATFIASLLEDFSRYAKGADRLDLLADGVAYRKFPMELSDEELAAMTREVNAVMLPYFQNGPAPARTRRIVAAIVVPDRPPAGSGTEGTSNASRETKDRPSEEEQ